MDISLFYTEQGSGFPLLLLHGNGENNEYFEHQKDFFAQHYRVIAIDTRGHGKSPRGTAPFTLKQFAEDLYSFMEEKSIEKAHILGFSDGGNIALLFALAYPHKTASLILNGANLSPLGIKRMYQVPIEAGYAIASLIAHFNKKSIPAKEMLALMVTQPNITPEELKNVQLPVLVIAGTKDMVEESHTKLIASSLPDSQLCILPGSHTVAADNSRAFNEAVLLFLSEHGTQREEHGQH